MTAWLALSLVWAAGFTAYVVLQVDDLFGDVFADGGLYLVLGLLYILPLGIVPPLALLVVGWVIFWIVTRLVRPDPDA